MQAYVGIDIGGTFTDYVVIEGGRIILRGKIPHLGDYYLSFNHCIEKILGQIHHKDIFRITISTTIITNFITSKQYLFPQCILMPGPGVDVEYLPIPKEHICLDAAIDFRGREILSLSEGDIQKLLALKGETFVIVGKFSGRNPAHELAVEELLLKRLGDKKTYLGHRISSHLNFPRRINTSLLYSAAEGAFNAFRSNISPMLNELDLLSKSYFLKADGGLAGFQEEINPIETVLSGPVGSVLGAKALASRASFITMDVGGSTTDFALVLDDKPVYAEKGIELNGFPTSVSTFAVYSVPLGGDSPVDVKTGEIASKRNGPALAFGGSSPTLTDSLNVVGLAKAGDYQLSKKHLSKEAGKKAVRNALDILSQEIRRIFTSWEREPAYSLWEMKQPLKSFPKQLLGLGGGAQGLTQALAAELNMEPIFPPNYDIANAIGTALAKPTVSVSLYCDSIQNKYIYLEKAQALNTKPTNIQELNNLAVAIAKAEYKTHAKDSIMPEIQITQQQQFNVIRGYTTSGKIITNKTIIPADVVNKVVDGK